ncbi:hypothetical protein B0H14DRAFT_3551358 [Mycena olivaceomarginata]|nr:hypothetical protein B0H14DRAFT_3551358 [Mycena olivaceomarginata]
MWVVHRKKQRSQVEKKMGTPIDYRPSSIVKAGRRAGGDERKADSTRSQEVSKQKKASAENPKAPKSKKKRQTRRALGANVPSRVVQAHQTPLRCLLSERNEWPGRSDPKKIRAEEIPQASRKRKRKTAATTSTRRPQVDVSPPSPDLHRSADDPPPPPKNHSSPLLSPPEIQIQVKIKTPTSPPPVPTSLELCPHPRVDLHFRGREREGEGRGGEGKKGGKEKELTLRPPAPKPQHAPGVLLLPTEAAPTCEVASFPLPSLLRLETVVEGGGGAAFETSAKTASTRPRAFCLPDQHHPSPRLAWFTESPPPAHANAAHDIAKFARGVVRRLLPPPPETELEPESEPEKSPGIDFVFPGARAMVACTELSYTEGDEAEIDWASSSWMVFLELVKTCKTPPAHDPGTMQDSPRQTRDALIWAALGFGVVVVDTIQTRVTGPFRVRCCLAVAPG